MKTFRIDCSKKYDIIIGSGFLYKAGRCIEEVLPSCKVCIVSDENVRALYGGEQSAMYQSLLSAGFDVYEYWFAPGEKSKNLQTAEALLDFLAENRFSREDALIAFGGGVTGDLTGFAAATYMRGIKYVQMPTTLLACVDSSVGGKTGVNLTSGKNLAGAFWQPELVLADTDVFATLTEELWQDGLAEMVKAGMIGDPSLLKDLADSSIQTLDGDALTSLILKAIAVKAAIVEEDERENGLRRLLNFGHTLGHAIEKCSGYEISHGRAIASGMLIEAAAAERKGLSSIGNAELLVNLLEKLGFNTSSLLADAKAVGTANLTQAASGDKKAHGDTITIVYPMRPGHCEMHELPIGELEDYIRSGL